MSRRCGWITAGRDRSIAGLGRLTAVVVAKVAVAVGMIFEWHRLTMCVRRIANRIVDRTGKLIGSRIAEKIGAKIDGTTVGRMPGEKFVGWIAPIRWLVSMDGKVGTMHGPLRWIGLTGLSEQNVRNGRSVPSGRRGRNVRSGLRGLGEISLRLNVRSACGAAPGDLPGAAMVLKLS